MQRPATPRSSAKRPPAPRPSTERQPAQRKQTQRPAAERQSAQRLSAQRPSKQGESRSRTSRLEESRRSPASGGHLTIAEIKSYERDERNRKIYRRRFAKSAVLLTIVLLLGFGGIFVYRSDFLSVEQVVVDGDDHLTADHLTELAAVPADSTLFRIDTDGIVTRLESDPWVKSASVSRNFFSALGGASATVSLEIVEREVGAVVELPIVSSDATSTYWLVSTDEIWLETATGTDAASIAITDVASDVEAASGGACNDEGIENALEIIDGLDSELVSQIVSISAPTAEATVLTLDNGVQVAIGSSENLSAKETVILELLSQHEGKISYINVRVVDSPSWRGVE